MAKSKRRRQASEPLTNHVPSSGPPPQQETTPCVGWDVFLVYDRCRRTGIQTTFQTGSWTEVINYLGKVRQPEERAISVSREKVFLQAA